MSLTADDIKIIKQMFEEQSDRFDTKIARTGLKVDSLIAGIDSKVDSLSKAVNTEIQKTNIRLDILTLELKNLRESMDYGFEKLRDDIYQDLGVLMHLNINPILDDHEKRITNLERKEVNLSTK